MSPSSGRIREMDSFQIPAYKIVEDKIKNISAKTIIERVEYDSTCMTYKFHLSMNNKRCDVLFSEEFLDDLNDFNGSKDSSYWQEKEQVLTEALKVAVSKMIDDNHPKQ